MSATVTDTELRRHKLGRLSAAADQRDGGIKEVLAVALELPAGLYQPLQIRLEGAATVSEFDQGLSLLVLTIDGREIKVSEHIAEEQNLRLELRVVHVP